MVDRTHREFTDDDIAHVADAYHSWRSADAVTAAGYIDQLGFCKSVRLADVQSHDYVLAPGRYVGVAPQSGDGEPFADKMTRLADQWRTQQASAAKLDSQIEANLQSLGF